MNRLILLLFYFSSIHVSASIPIESISLETALQSRAITASFHYTSGPEHQRIAGAFHNNTQKAFDIEVPSGSMFQAAQENWQNHVITKRTKFRLLPKKDTVLKFTAFCFERGDGGPRMNSRFTLITKKHPAGQKLCQLLDSLNDMGYSAQTSIWQLFAKGTPNRIYGEDSATVMLLRNYVGTNLNMSVKPYKPRVYIKNVCRGSTRQRITRLRPTAFHNADEYKLSNIKADDFIQIQVFSYEQDKLLSNASYKTMLIQEKELSRFIYGVNLGSLVPADKYIVRVMKNGVVHEEWLYKTT